MRCAHVPIEMGLNALGPMLDTNGFDPVLALTIYYHARSMRKHCFHIAEEVSCAYVQIYIPSTLVFLFCNSVFLSAIWMVKLVYKLNI